MFSAKGRTNVELREQFTLPTGASQSMTAFKSKPRADRGESPTSSVSGDTRNGAQGPITKVSLVLLYPSGVSLSVTRGKYSVTRMVRSNILLGSLLVITPYISNTPYPIHCTQVTLHSLLYPSNH